MYFENIIALVAFAGTALAVNDKKRGSKVPPALKPEATEAEVLAVDCSKLDAQTLKGLKNQKLCSVLTGECLNKFSLVDVPGTCLSNVAQVEFEKLSGDKIDQIIATKPHLLKLTKDQFNHIQKSLKKENIPAGFSGYIVRNFQFLAELLSTKNGPLSAAILTAENLAAVDHKAFTRFGGKLISQLNDDAFSKVSATQLNLIPAESFGSFKRSQWPKVNPVALSGLTSEQTEKLPLECLSATTDAQIKNFGKPVKTAPRVANPKNQAAYTYSVLERAKYKNSHPCPAVLAVKDKLEAKKAKLFETHCKQVEAFSPSSGNKLKATLTIGGIMVAMAFLL